MACHDDCESCGDRNELVAFDARGDCVCAGCLLHDLRVIHAALRAGDTGVLPDLFAIHATANANAPEIALAVEAGDAARRGDLDECLHRLRLAVDPKWTSVAQCRAAYDEAIGRADACPSECELGRVPAGEAFS